MISLLLPGIQLSTTKSYVGSKDMFESITVFDHVLIHSFYTLIVFVNILKSYQSNHLRTDAVYCVDQCNIKVVKKDQNSFLRINYYKLTQPIYLDKVQCRIMVNIIERISRSIEVEWNNDDVSFSIFEGGDHGID